MEKEYISTSVSTPPVYQDVIGLVGTEEVVTYMYPNKTWKYNHNIKLWRPIDS